MGLDNQCFTHNHTITFSNGIVVRLFLDLEFKQADVLEWPFYLILLTHGFQY